MIPGTRVTYGYCTHKFYDSAWSDDVEPSPHVLNSALAVGLPLLTEPQEVAMAAKAAHRGKRNNTGPVISKCASKHHLFLFLFLFSGLIAVRFKSIGAFPHTLTVALDGHSNMYGGIVDA